MKKIILVLAFVLTSNSLVKASNNYKTFYFQYKKIYFESIIDLKKENKVMFWGCFSIAVGVADMVDHHEGGISDSQWLAIFRKQFNNCIDNELDNSIQM